jgi:hypothetical protein
MILPFGEELEIKPDERPVFLVNRVSLELPAQLVKVVLVFGERHQRRSDVPHLPFLPNHMKLRLLFLFVGFGPG